MITKFVLIMNLFWWYLDYLINSFLQLWWMSSLNRFKRKSLCLVGEIIRRMKNFGEKSEEKMKVESVWLGWKIGKKMIEYMSFLTGLPKLNSPKLGKKKAISLNWEKKMQVVIDLLETVHLLFLPSIITFSIFYFFVISFCLFLSFLPRCHTPTNLLLVFCFFVFVFFPYLFSIKSMLFFKFFLKFF